jgi:Uma2 family endonuclease
MARTQMGLTLEEFLKLPEQKPALEYHQGRVTQKVSPQGQHGALQFDVASFFDRFMRPRRLGRVFTELRTTYAGSSLVPDVAVYRRERVPRYPNGEVADVFKDPPDIAVEIRSPGQSLSQQIEKCRWFVENGAGIALLVDPIRRSIHRVVAGAEPVILRGDDRVDLDAVLPGFELTPRQLFDTLLD